MTQYVWLVPLLPLIGFLIAGLGRNTLGKSLLGWIPSLAVFGSFVVSVFIFLEVKSNAAAIPTFAHVYDFISMPQLTIPFAFQVDQLSSLFLLVITGIGFLIHVYSISYMHSEDNNGYGKFFAYLNLFVFSMLLLVLGSNYVIMFIGWEGVGLCSYLLIGFWYKNTEYAIAAKKAFIMNRIGDVGFLIGMFLIYKNFGTLEYQAVFAQAGSLVSNGPIILAITLCLFIGATGKSAQIPLFTWLPDAMAGPTPVSALIHAATMVTAGIYMITRSHVLFNMAPITQQTILLIGLVTALVTATIATQQNDIKKVLAYSTVSQLGFMFMALGVGAYTAAVFHVITHAFFKALMFLGSGSVIHGMGGEQDIRKMGGLKNYMKTTWITFLIGCVAIAGIPPLSGFFSKDEIMLHVFENPFAGKIFWVLGMIAAFLTAYYMFRLLLLTFYGKFRGTHEQEHHLHESPALITVPLIILAILSLVGGLIGIPHIFGHHWLQSFMQPLFANSFMEHSSNLSAQSEMMLMGIATVIACLGILLAYFYYKNYNPAKNAKGFSSILENKWYFDEAYDNTIVKPIYNTSDVLNTTIEPKVIDGLVNGVGTSLQKASSKFRFLQSGMVGFYMFIMVAGVLLLFSLLFLYH
jgi:NADH-quinone oxidoreductase subunit L